MNSAVFIAAVHFETGIAEKYFVGSQTYWFYVFDWKRFRRFLYLFFKPACLKFVKKEKNPSKNFR